MLSSEPYFFPSEYMYLYGICNLVRLCQVFVTLCSLKNYMLFPFLFLFFFFYLFAGVAKVAVVGQKDTRLLNN